jgi:hypothetical protein
MIILISNCKKKEIVALIVQDKHLKCRYCTLLIGVNGFDYLSKEGGFWHFLFTLSKFLSNCAK